MGGAKIEEESLDIRRYAGLFFGYWWLLLLLPIVFGVLGWLLVRNQERVYEASAALLVQQRRGAFSSGVSDFILGEQLAVTYATLIRSSPFLRQVLDKKALEKKDIHLNVSSLKFMIRASTDNSPPSMVVRVRHADPELTYTTANILAEEFIDYVIELRLRDIANVQAVAAAQGLTDSQGLLNAQVSLTDSVVLLEPATRPTSPILPRTRRTIFLAVILGGIVGTAFTLMLSSLKDTVRSPEELRRRFGEVSLGAVFKWTPRDVEKDQLVVWNSPQSVYSESFKQIRANIQFAMVGGPGKTYLVTSPGPAEGKTTILCNLAIAMAQAGKRVVIVDGDLRRPSVHRLFQIESKEPGLSTFLAAAEISSADIIRWTALEGVGVVPSGPLPPNPSELLGSPRMSVLLEQLGQLADVVLVDSPPLLVVADASIVAAQVDGGIIVVDAVKTRSQSLREAMATLSSTQVRLVGVILNKLKRNRFGYPYYYEHYTSRDGETPVEAGADSFYKRPVTWVRSVLTKRNSSADRS